MFMTGKVLFDKTGELARLIVDARKYMSKQYRKQSKITMNWAKYNLWDMCDNLEEIFEAKGKEFYLIYFVHLYRLYEYYAEVLRFDSIQVHKLRKFLINHKEKKKYRIPDFADKTFVRSFVKAINLKKKPNMMKAYRELTNHVLDQMGGFNIDGWKIRSPL